MNILKSSLLVLATASTALSASAQLPPQTVCYTDTIPLQLTNWAGSVSIPLFDGNLGTLQSIQFRLTGRVEGSARAESLDAAPATVTTSLSSNITLTRPDLTPLVITLPVANFVNNFTAFDGTIDFGGTSGATYPNINASDTQMQTSPPPLSDLALFTGVGNIVLPVVANGASTATGAGNLITQFSTQAAADVQVCYTYLPNNPPTIQCPGPLMASAGVPLQFQVCASDLDVGDVVTLNASNVPAGMTFTPALPTSGNPVCVTVDWTPNGTQVGVFSVIFTANDTHQGASSSCTVTINSAECHLLVSSGAGSSQATIFGHLYDTQLAGVRRSFPVTMVDMPTFAWNQIPQTLTVQLVMYNPLMFPANPDQHSQAMRVTKTSFGDLACEYFGTTDGIGIRAQVYWVSGQPRVRFPFSIQGM